MLDVLLDMSPHEQELQLAGWDESHPVVAARLRELLEAAGEAAASGFLETLPVVTGADPRHLSAYQPEDRIGPWRLRARIGHGGMAEVWLARREDGLLDRDVALKLPLPGYGTGRYGERFARERSILAGLTHPHIARLYDAGIDANGQAWLALEHVAGDDIVAWCRQHEANTERRLGLFLQVCNAVQYAHGRLVLHRDLKAGNIRVNEEGQVRLLDFGIAQLLDGDEETSSLTLAGGAPLSLEGAAPEQVLGERLGIAADVYALGALLYRLLSGEGPYEPAQPGRRALTQAILEQAPRRPSERAGSIALRRAMKGDLDTIILKALEKHPGDRYATAGDLASDIRRHLQREPVVARRPSVRYIVARFVGRHKVAVFAAAAAIAALVAVTAVAVQQARVARNEVARTEAVNQFVLGIFNPGNQPIPDTSTRNMPAHELVAVAAAHVADSMPDQPEARFQLMHDLAALTTSLGMADASSRLHEARVAQSLAQMGEASPEYADALLDRTSELEGQGKYPQAYQDAQKALAIYKAAGVSSPDRLARAHYQVAAFGMHSHSAGDPDDLRHLQAAADLWRGRYGKSEYGSVMERLVQFYLLADRPRDAYEAALSGMLNNRRQFGESNWKTAAAEEQTGLALSTLLRPAEGEPLLRQALATQESVWGDGHFLVARSKMYLGNLLATADRHAEAGSLLREASTEIHADQWRGNKVVLTAFIDDANAELDDKWGDQEHALATCEPYFKGVSALQAPVHLRLDLVCAHVALNAGRTSVARQLVSDAAATVAANWPTDVRRMAPVWRRRGDIMAASGQPVDAMHAYSEAIRLADVDDLDTRSGSWQGLAALAGDDLGSARRLAMVELLNRIESLPSARFYQLYADRLRPYARNEAGAGRAPRVDD
ncbi:serine/threonine-protein kinase [Dyella telluris]|uniref:Serine/threonine protein kinase n=1 Tax=Dyella telluris TaxID=2763498 RepID=A0A7G8Q3A3_9GAMM|nr:serine/threonine-protein kinase [Dyella telluris]QNK01261.1 serine/threonine protein kinase [Dyella telluris]